MLERFKEWFAEIQSEAIAGKKLRAIEQFQDESQWKRIIWRAPEKNAAIKTKFRDEGSKLGFKSRPGTKAGEWLYDFVWRDIDDEKQFTEVVLAMEIELSDMEEYLHRHDFYKLLQADSPYKIFVFQVKTEADAQTAMEELKKAAAKYRFKIGSEFLLCAWCTKPNAFVFETFEAIVGEQKVELIS